MKIHRIIFVLSLFLACSAIADTGRVTNNESDLTDNTLQHIYRSAIENKDPAAMYELGNMFDEGVGVAQNYEEASKWFYRAADLGSGEAMNSLGIAYATGRGVPQSYALSFRWLFKAVEKGSIEAMSNIAKAFYLGAGRPVSYSEAAKWFELAAMNGNASAMNNLALMYDKGMGVTQNHHVAVVLLERSAKRGYPLAMKNLGILYLNGETVKQDDVVAFAWMEAALEAGLPGEDRDAVAEKLGTLAKQLGAKELARARTLVGEISAVVMRDQQSGKARSDSAPPKLNVL
jgi:TPR repeat protein